MFKDSIEELTHLLYTKLTESENGELSFKEIVAIIDTKAEFSFRKVEGGAIKALRENYDNVLHLRDETGKPYLRLKQ